MKHFLLFVIGTILYTTLYSQTDLIISEYVEGWSNNKAIEVYNPTNAPINLKNYRLTRYSNGADTPPAEASWSIALPDVNLAPYRTYVCVLDKRDPLGEGQEAPVWEQLADRADVFLCPNYEVSKALYHNGDDAVALEKADGTLVDLFARWGAPRPVEAALPGSTNKVRAWTNTAPHFTGVGIAITADHTLVRKSSVTDGIKANPSSFNPLAEYDSLSANTFDHLGWHKFDKAPANAKPVFEKDKYEFKIWKQAQKGAELGTIKATDAENDALKYYFNKGNFIYNAADVRKVPFALDKSTGKITVADPTALIESTWDTLYISATVTDGTSETENIFVTAILSTSNVSNPLTQLASTGLLVYPNPNTLRMVNIRAVKNIQSVEVYNITGQLDYRKTFATHKPHQLIHLNSSKPGVYFTKVYYTDNTNETRRLVVK
jgi:hypothetical protein